MKTENDTFVSLKRIPFEQIIMNLKFPMETYERALENILYLVCVNGVDWKEASKVFATGWEYEDFINECHTRFDRGRYFSETM